MISQKTEGFSERWPTDASTSHDHHEAAVVGVANVSAGINKSIHVQAPVAPPKEPKQRERPGTPPDRRQRLVSKRRRKVLRQVDVPNDLAVRLDGERGLSVRMLPQLLADVVG